MKNKKGFLLAEETLKIIIAVISIGFLVYFLVSLYNSNKNSKGLEQAEASLEFLMQEIANNAEIISIYNPARGDLSNQWDIISWPNAQNQIPNTCSNLGWENCLCICIKINPDNCGNKGVCRESDFSIAEGNIEIKNPPVNLIIDYENKIITRAE